MKIIIGTRGSELALWQANWVKDRLTAAGQEIELKTIKTSGERLRDALLTQTGTKGLFVKEIEEELAAGSIDLAVHSLKDLPTEQPPGLSVVAVPEREDARDVLVSHAGETLASLPAGSRVGTSSLRRRAQLWVLRRDLQVIPVRGNIDTRLKKLQRGEYDALVLAAAGLSRLGLAKCIAYYFPIEQMCPAVGQGALAIEARHNDEQVKRAVEALDHRATHLAVRAERATLQHLGGGCQVPIAAHAVINGQELRLLAMVANPETAEMIRTSAVGPCEKPEELGVAVAQQLLKGGARALLESMHV